MSEYSFGETVWIGNTFKTTEDVLYDPDAITLKIYDPEGTLKDTVAYPGTIVRESEGVFHATYDVTGDVQGYWYGVWEVTVGTQTDISEEQFYCRSSGEKLYCTVEQAISRAGMDPTNSGVTLNETRDFIRGAMGEIDQMHQRTYSYNNEETEWFDTAQADRNTVIDTIFLDHRPVLSITSLAEYDQNNDLITTHDSDEYWIDLETGRIVLSDTEFEHQAHRIKVVYKAGYAQVPAEINALCAVMAGLSILDSAIGASTSDVTNYTVGGMSVAIGETYVVMRTAREKLNMTYTRMVKNIGNRRGDMMI